MSLPRCHRCQGCLAWSYLMENIGGGYTIECVKCLNCGHYYYDMDHEVEGGMERKPMTSQAIGDKMGISRQAVQQIEQRAIKKLRVLFY